MKKYLVFLPVFCMLACAPAMAVRSTAVPITHTQGLLYQAYAGTSGETDVAAMGYMGTGSDLIGAVPGVLRIIPGTNWSSFIGAYGHVPYSIKSIVLKKQTPQIVQCADVFPARTISQQGRQNIRLVWPLMYEIPGTTFTLTIVYGTIMPYDDDGAGPNPSATVHTEVWSWKVDATLNSMKRLLQLGHELAFGTSEVPLVSDEALYPVLQAKLSAIEAAIAAGNTAAAGSILGDFEMEVMDAWLPVTPISPSPTGPGTGIAETEENPFACKLMADAEYVGKACGILQPGM